MPLVAVRLRPELRPAAVVVLSAEQIVHCTPEAVAEARFVRGLVEPSQIDHLQRGCPVVGRRVVAAVLLGSDCDAFVVAERSCHVDVLRPTARCALVEQHLVTDAQCIGSLEESWIGRVQFRVARMSCQTGLRLRLSACDNQTENSEDKEKSVLHDERVF